MLESKKLPQIVGLGNKEIDELLGSVNFGHLGLSRENRPYVVPIHFAYARSGLYFYTTEGMKTEILDENPRVCLQVEDIKDREHWRSVIIVGTALRVTVQHEVDKAMKLIKAVNPKLVPAWSIVWLDDWVRSLVDVIYRIDAESTSGRGTIQDRD